MSCRSLPATSAATTFARLNCTLSDVQVLSAFHSLRAEAARTGPTPTADEWQQWLAAEQHWVTYHPNLTEARRRSLLARLNAATTSPLPDAPTWSALQRIRPYTQAMARNLDQRLLTLADRLNLTTEQVRERFDALTAEVDTRRDAPAPVGYSRVTRDEYRHNGLPGDRQTIHALHRLADIADRASPVHARRRVTRHPVQSTAIAEVGYDPDGGRLEVVFRSSERVYAYRNVPPQVYEDMRTASAGRTWQRAIRNNPAVHYSTAAAAAADAFRAHCSRCGQFVSQSSGHRCQAAGTTPPPGAVTSTPTGDTPVRARPLSATTVAHHDPVNGMVVHLPLTSTIEYEAATGPLLLSVSHHSETAEGHDGIRVYGLTGTMTVSASADGLQADLGSVRCNCFTYRQTGACPHVSGYADAVTRRLNPARAAIADGARHHRDAEQALARDWTRSQRWLQDEQRRWRTDAEVMYTATPAAFLAVADQARADQAAGRAAVPYLTDDATDGMLTRQSGTGFGVEIEFDFPDDMRPTDRAAALEAVGRELHTLGLTSHADQQEYHAAAGRPGGYATGHHGGWSFEADDSVAAEIVSPIMYDEPETWRNLQTVCDVVKRHGGVASARTGSHVHVGTAATMSVSTAALTELTRLHSQHEDVLYRLSQNPHVRSGEHRPLTYCAPTPEVPRAGYSTLDQIVTNHQGHYTALNMEAAKGGASDHVEFRTYDGSLDPAVIQTQVKISAAMTRAAARLTADGPGRERPREEIGSHWSRTHDTLAGSRRALTPAEQVDDTATARALLDTLFRRAADKQQVAALFGANRWQRRRPGVVGDVGDD